MNKTINQFVYGNYNVFFFFVFFFKFNFTVPPETPQIYSEQIGMIQDRVGPLVEGTDLTLICLVRGGLPPPQITWMSRGRQLPGIMVDLNFQSTLNSKLVIKNLSRIHQLAIYTCHASNFPRMSVSTNVTIELTRKFFFINIFFL